MKTVSLSGSLRENVGKKDAIALRRAGRIPAVIYGGEEQIHISIESIAFDKIIYTPEVYFIDLTVGDNTYKAIIQDMQFHPVTDNVLHIDFLQIFDGKAVKMEIPVRLTGTSPGVMKGGKLVHRTKRLIVKATPENLPDAVTVDISSLDIAQAIKVGTLTVENAELMDPKDKQIVSVKTSRNMAAEEEEEEEAPAAE